MPAAIGVIPALREVPPPRSLSSQTPFGEAVESLQGLWEVVPPEAEPVLSSLTCIKKAGYVGVMPGHKYARLAKEISYQDLLSGCA